VKLLLCSDLHCDSVAASRLVKLASTVDVFIAAGDFANVRRGLSKTIDVLRAITCPAVLVAGNAETTEELTAACRGWQSAHVLHGTGVTIDGVPFFGLGGAVPVTPFGSWSYDLSETEAARLLADCPSGGVLVSHSPPKGVVDRDSGGRSLGSTAVRDVIQRVQPRLVVCGHIHASAGKEEMLGLTPVVNAGPEGIVRPIVVAAGP
jgi:Icc-related predicted phosphoesterase